MRPEREPLNRVLALAAGSGDLVAVLERSVPVMAVVVSASGALLRAASTVPEHSSGVLVLSAGGSEARDLARVVRCQAAPGAGWPFQVAIELLGGAPAMRVVLQRLAAG